MSIRLVIDKGDSNSDTPKDSLGAMIIEANRQGWLPDRNLSFIPEILPIYQKAAEYFTKFIYESEPEYLETFVYHTCRYLFAKGVEGVILWGMSPAGKVSVYFHPKHLLGDIETEVPHHLHKTVVDSMLVGESLFEAHQGFVLQAQKNKDDINLHAEVSLTLQWISRFGITYALYNRYQALK